jgi:hypothetical protein
MILIPNGDIGDFGPKPMISVIPAQAGIQENLRKELNVRRREHNRYSWLHRSFHAGME